MTITQASAVNTLLSYYMRTCRDTESAPTDDQAKQAAVLLAAYAHSALRAGWTSEKVMSLWRHRQVRVPVCDTELRAVVNLDDSDYPSIDFFIGGQAAGLMEFSPRHNFRVMTWPEPTIDDPCITPIRRKQVTEEEEASVDEVITNV